MSIDLLPSIKQYLKYYNILPDKRYGQNFLLDTNTCNKIAQAAGLLADKVVIEIGAGLGSLTRAILQYNQPKLLIAIEKDRRFQPILKELQGIYPEILTIVNTDALRVKLADLSEKPVCIVGNLPYNISTPLIFHWLEEIERIESLTLTMQKEVVDRICSSFGTKEYGRLSIMCQLFFNPVKCFSLSPKVFYPLPKVYSTTLKLVPKPLNELPSPKLISKLRALVTTAFSQRRKMLRTSIKSLIPNSEQVLLYSCISPQKRAEDLSIQEYILLCKNWITSSSINK